MGLAANEPASSLSAFIQRPARTGGPDQTTRVHRKRHRAEGHEGLGQSQGKGPVKRPKSIAELRNKGPSFGSLGRESTVGFPPTPPDSALVSERDLGPSPWRDLEFDSEATPLSTMLEFANAAASKAKPGLARVA